MYIYIYYVYIYICMYIMYTCVLCIYLYIIRCLHCFKPAILFIIEQCVKPNFWWATISIYSISIPT